MTLELNQIAAQVQAMGQSSAEQAIEKREKVKIAKALLQEYSAAFDELETRVRQAEQVQEAVRFSWLGAAPAGELLAEYHPAPSMPERMNLIASDGSQIYPDRHAIALYYLVNIGVIIYQHGSSLPPTVKSNADLYYKDDDVLDQGYPVSTSIVNVKRDVGEIGILAQLAADYRADDCPTMAIIDGQLTLRLIDLPAREQEKYQKVYLRHFNRLLEQNANIVSYIDRSQNASVMSLLNLARLTPETITEDTLRQHPFIGLPDAALFDDLAPGQRTAIFNQRAKANIAYQQEGHQIHFFYMNTGTDQQPNLARVEIPIWVARDRDRLNLVHATLLHQAKMASGYPYVLSRAHELAIITPKEREALETMLSVSLLRQDQDATISRKQQQKNLLGNREAFRL